jgi:predicted transcriptional regulator
VIIVLRVHFARQDLGRIRLATGPALMWEVLLSLHRLTDHDGALVFDGWRHRVGARLPARARWLLELAPRGRSPAFLTSATGTGDLERELDVVLATPRPQIRADLARVGARPQCRQAAALADGAEDAVRDLGAAIRSYHRISLAPYWPQIQVAVQADLTVRARSLAHAGIDTVLSGLHPQARWRPPVLELPFAADQDLRLGGRGLLLLPAFFCWGHPITLAESAPDPVLVLPVEHDLAWLRRPAAAGSEHSLAALLGRTRAFILTTIAGGSCTTTQLASRAGVSIASASQHAAVLGNAGLITTRRRGGCVIRTITPLGITLIKNSIPPSA